MFKRMSILVRRATDDRSQFAEKWQSHGGLVSRLRQIRSYVQNHVVEEFAAAAPMRADGIVELWFDSAAAMAEAFASDLAKPIKLDEPNFLGHGTGYVIAEASPVRTAEQGNKLVVALRAADPALAEKVTDSVRSMPGCTEVVRDDVASLIARPEFREGPQPVDAFLHASFEDVAAAQRAGRLITDTASGASLAVFRVRTVTMI
jgi:uncharacterized protein (TIGR02118 family)